MEDGERGLIGLQSSIDIWRAIEEDKQEGEHEYGIQSDAPEDDSWDGVFGFLDLFAKVHGTVESWRMDQSIVLEEGDCK